jgi:hypothetical protein
MGRPAGLGRGILGALAVLAVWVWALSAAQAADAGTATQPEPVSVAPANDGGAGPALTPGSSLPRPLKVEVSDRPPEVPEHPLVIFRGNLLFSDFVYRSLLDLPRRAAATPGRADEVAAKVCGFLRSAGYDLATVVAHVEADQIAVDIDEGQVDKIVVLGGGIVETLRFKLELFLPANVFDRLRLEQQLGDLARRNHLNHYSYELVRVEAKQKPGPQIESLEPALGLPGIQPGQRYELHILIGSNPWSHGFSPEVSVDPLEGLGAGGGYRAQGLFFDADRWEAFGRAAGAIRPYLDTPGSRPEFTRAFGQARWLSPPVVAQSLRPAITIRADLQSVQRADLHLENFDQATFGTSLDVAWAPVPQLTLAGGVGIERRFLFAIEKAQGASPVVDATPGVQTRLYAELLVDAVLNPQELRTDRKNHLVLESRLYAPMPLSEEALWLRANYRRRFAFGWNELWVNANATSLIGQVLYPDEESIGKSLHGAFSASVFAHSLIASGFEYRFSLIRDALKVGLFYDQVLYGALDRTGGPTRPATAGAGGPSLHLLLADEFELGAYLAFGWRAGATDFAATLALGQVF